MKTKYFIALVALSFVASVAVLGQTQPAEKPGLAYSVTVPGNLAYNQPAPGALNRKDGRTVLMSADLFLAAHRAAWVKCVVSYLQDKEVDAPRLSQGLGVEIEAAKAGIREAKARLSELENRFGKPAVKEYLKSQGYDRPPASK